MVSSLAGSVSIEASALSMKIPSYFSMNKAGVTTVTSAPRLAVAIENKSHSSPFEAGGNSCT